MFTIFVIFFFWDPSLSRYFKYVIEISQHECQLKPHLLSIGSQCLSPSAIISDCYGCRMDCKMRVERRRDITAGTVWREGGIRNTKIYCFQSNCVSSPNQMGILPSSLNCLERRRIFKVLSAEKQFSFMRMFHYIFYHIIICTSDFLQFQLYVDQFRFYPLKRKSFGWLLLFPFPSVPDIIHYIFALKVITMLAKSGQV